MTVLINPDAAPQVDLRPPSEVMKLKRMGSFFPTRLSFLRSLLRKLVDEEVGISRSQIELNEHGYGHAVYHVELDGRAYSLIAFSEELAPENRTDRVIAEAWDACFVLFDGVPTSLEIAELHSHAIHQEAGKYDERVLVLSRANKSVRLFEYVANSLADGTQPDIEQIGKIGYLMRTTAVYGNGKFGMADRAQITSRPSLSQPFRLEMLTVYLIREFTFDLVNHVATARGGNAALNLSEAISRKLGIGNSTGLGMAPFLVNHPVLINNWMMVRETALARVRALGVADVNLISSFTRLLERAGDHLQDWNVDDEVEQARIVTLRQDFAAALPQLLELVNEEHPWDSMVRFSESCSVDFQEFIIPLVLEEHGELIDGLCECMEDVSGLGIDPFMNIATFQEIVAKHYGWVEDLDLDVESSSAMVWYVSEEKLEPRMGERSGPQDERREMPHHIAHKVRSMLQDLSRQDDGKLIAEFLMLHPKHRDIVRRIQTVAKFPYGEIQDNLIARGVRPIDLLRCKLSFFGASKFDPKSDRWTRITLYQGAPTAKFLSADTVDDVFLPVTTTSAE